jgi:hypothetical protein
MTTTVEFNDAMNAQSVRYAEAKDGADRAQVAHENQLEADRLFAEWKVWLAAQHAADFSPAVQALIFEQADILGDADGFNRTEYHYFRLALFLRKAQAA